MIWTLFLIVGGVACLLERRMAPETRWHHAVVAVAYLGIFAGAAGCLDRGYHTVTFDQADDYRD